MGLKAAGAARPTRLRYGVSPTISSLSSFSFHDENHKERVSRSRCAHCGGSSAARPNGPGAFYYVVASRVFPERGCFPTPRYNKAAWCFSCSTRSSTLLPCLGFPSRPRSLRRVAALVRRLLLTLRRRLRRSPRSLLQPRSAMLRLLTARSLS